MKGKVYLLVERSGRGGRELRVTSHRMTKPSRGAAEGVWVGINLDIPESIFGPYEAALTLPENNLTGTVVVMPRDHEEEVVGEDMGEEE